MSELELTRTYSDPTVTEILRRLLDERGVEWDYGITGVTTTRFNVNGLNLTFTPMRDGLMCSTILTPEQVIATTLGKEPDDATVLKLHDRMNVALLEYERALGIEKADGTIFVPLVFEMHNLLEEAAATGPCNCSNNCTNGERTNETCHDKNGFNPDMGFECTVCGAMTDGYMLTTEDTGHYTQFNYCPNCGRRVI